MNTTLEILVILIGLSVFVLSLSKAAQMLGPAKPSVSVRVEMLSDDLEGHDVAYEVRVEVPPGSSVPEALLSKIYADLAQITLRKS